MNLFEVYPLLDVELVKGEGACVYDTNGQKYLDLYGGHAVISIGHGHPHYLASLKNQMEQLVFYSNSVHNSLQAELATRIAQTSGYNDYNVFFINSGAEANENAIKIASFHTGKARIVAFEGAFHGRTAGAVAATDNQAINPPYSAGLPITRLPLGNIELLNETLAKGDVAAVLIEGIQGVAGIVDPGDAFLQELADTCTKHKVTLILDEVQSGFGRTGKFFAHQSANIKADMITCAKGMGNGFPVGAVLINPKYEARHGLLGTTFGGNHLACAVVHAVLDVIEDEKLIEHAAAMGNYIKEKAGELLPVENIRGRGLMIGLDLNKPIAEIRKNLIFEHHIFTGNSKNKNVLRLLPPLNITMKQIDTFFAALKQELHG